MNAEVGFNRLVGLKIIGPQDGIFVLELPITENHLHSAGKVHGGVYLMLLDTVMSRALHNSVEGKRLGATVEIKTNFLRSCAGGTIRAEGKLIHGGRRINYLESELYDDENNLLAKASGSFMFLDT